jgi:hypothetical protein
MEAGGSQRHSVNRPGRSGGLHRMPSQKASHTGAHGSTTQAAAGQQANNQSQNKDERKGFWRRCVDTVCCKNDWLIDWLMAIIALLCVISFSALPYCIRVLVEQREHIEIYMCMYVWVYIYIWISIGCPINIIYTLIIYTCLIIASTFMQVLSYCAIISCTICLVVSALNYTY